MVRSSGGMGFSQAAADAWAADRGILDNADALSARPTFDKLAQQDGARLLGYRTGTAQDRLDELGKRTMDLREYGPVVSDPGADHTAAIASMIAEARSVGLFVTAPGLTLNTTAPIDLRGNIAGVRQDERAGLIGAGPERTVINVQHTGRGVRLTGRNKRLEGVTIQYPDLPTWSDTDRLCLALEDWLSDSIVANVWVRNGFKGIACIEGDNADFSANTFSNTYRDLRAMDCIDTGIEMAATNTGTGNLCLNLRVMAPNLRKVRRMLALSGQLGSVGLTFNLEHANFYESALDLTNAQAVIAGLHLEGLHPLPGARMIAFSHGRSLVQFMKMELTTWRGEEIESLVCDGTYATLTLKPNRGYGTTPGVLKHPHEPGDKVSIEGYADAAVNGTFAVYDCPGDLILRVPCTATAGTKLLAAGSFMGAIVRGNSALSSSTFAYASNHRARALHIQELSVRDQYSVGASAASLNAVRWFRNSTDSPGRLEIDHLSNDAQTANAHWDQANPIIAVERSGGTAVYHFRNKANLSSSHKFYVQNATGVTGFGGLKTPMRMRGDYAVEVSDAGADQALAVPGGSAYALLVTWQPATRARSGNVVTLKNTGTAHGIHHGRAVRVLSVSGGTTYDATRVPVILVDANTIRYAKTGADEAETADSGTYVMVLENTLDPAVFMDTSTAPLQVSRLGDLFKAQFAVPAMTIAAGASSSVTVSLAGARVGDRVDLAFAGLLAAGLRADHAVTANDTITVRISNPTAGDIAQPVILARIELVRT